MPLSVSIFCSPTKTCDHNSPQLLTTTTTTATVNSYTWPQLSAVENSSVIRPDSGALAKCISEQMGCSLCFVFTNLMKSCYMDNCRDTMHVLDIYFSDEDHSTLLAESSSLCWHSANPFVQLACEQNNIVISNSLANDPRVNVEMHPPSNHETIYNVMVVPLCMDLGSESRIIGAVFMANKIDVSNSCNGFTVEDYTKRCYMFCDLSSYLLLSFFNNEISRFQSTMERVNMQHSREMSELSTSRDTFIATMSHEIRTPLNAINGYNEILMKHISSPNAISTELLATSLRSQRDAVLQLTQLIGNILDFSKLKSKSLTLDSRPFDIRECVRKVITICMPDCAQKNINLSMNIADNVPNVLLGDELRIFQVTMNLLTNAVKYTSHGYIELQISAEVQNNGMHMIKVSVIDTGRGIPLSLQKRIFENFLQIRDSSTTAASVQGVGLGLSISKELVTLMGGELVVESDGRSGSTFAFTVLLRDSKCIDAMIKQIPENFNNSGVLIVDDMEINRVLIRRMFLEWNFTPHACSSLEEAMYTLDTFSNSYFKIVVIDMDIAGESGLTLARRIAKDQKFSKLILLAASSLGSSFAGADEFDAVHVKPLRADAILADIVRLLHNGPTRQIHYDTPSITKKRLRNGDNGGLILIVDDDKPSLDVTKSMLQMLGYDSKNIVTTSSGRTALEMLKNNTGKFLCVFMDLVMPQMSGIECTRIITQEPLVYGKPYIIALTADAVDSTKHNVMNAGAQTFVSKPVSLNMLSEVLAQIPKPIKGKKKIRRRSR